MYSLALLSDFKGFIASSGWILIWFGFIATLLYALDDHRDTCDEIRNATGRQKFWKRCKLGLLWSLPVLALIGAIGSQWSSEKSDGQIATLTANLNDATNELAKLKIKAKDRTITLGQREKILQCFVPAPNRGEVFVTSDWLDIEAKKFANEIRGLLTDLHFSVKPYEYNGSDNNNAIVQSIGENGVVVIVKDWNRIPSWTGAIVNCFTNAGIACSGMETSRIWCPSNAIVVWVGRKP